MPGLGDYVWMAVAFQMRDAISQSQLLPFQPLQHDLIGAAIGYQLIDALINRPMCRPHAIQTNIVFEMRLAVAHASPDKPVRRGLVSQFYDEIIGQTYGA